MIYSPFEKYCDSVDKDYFSNDRTISDYFKLAYQLEDERPNYINDLLIEDWKFRSKYGLNVVMSIEGQQGQFKSLFGIYNAFVLGEIFDYPYDMKKNLYILPEELDEGLRSFPFRTTHVLDEQPHKRVGIGSASGSLSLQDYEEQGRATQKNIIYISPQIFDHSHYFVFSSISHDRINQNNFCEHCPIEIANECYKNLFTTLCPNEFRLLKNGESIKFFERIGYPKTMTFLLRTKRKIDGLQVPRGFVTVPMVSPQTHILYQEMKMQNLIRLEKHQDNLFKAKDEIAQEFLKGYSEKCLKIVGGLVERTYKLKDIDGEVRLETKIFDTRKYSIVSSDVIEGFLYEFLGSERRFTIKEIKLIVARIKNNLYELCFEKNKELYLERKEKNKY